MQMEQALSGAGLIVTPLESRLDAAVAPAFKDALAEPIESGPSLIVLDLQHVTFLDSSGLGALVHVLKRVTQRGGRLNVCGITPAVMAVLRLTRMDRMLRTFPTREAASAV